ncbi:M1 family metallopeptidase [Tenggerimyces flavus]|uniref:Aminopeptidase N n=1 Tax=Tenggerimyces flavus TaxID=1708749 RepID=A0ABV7YED3_9ACTN|nr:M1 family metallopeptidase [Tenggerimyces flavus]MBM7791313.1 aminopeptidase N [Tenggerimyces flavus]
MFCSRRSVLLGSAALAATSVPILGSGVAYAGSGSPGAPGIGDEVFPNLGNGGYLVDLYLLDLDYRETTKLVDGCVTAKSRAQQDLSSFYVDSVGLVIHSVEVDGRSATFSQQGEELLVTPVRKLRKGERFSTKIRFTADPRLKVPGVISGWCPTDDGFAIAPQPAGAHTIFPCNDHPSDKAGFVVTLTVPQDLTAVASGVPIGLKTRNGRTTHTFWSEHPIATEILQAVVGNYTIVERGTVRGTRLRDVVPSHKVELLEPALALTPGLLDWIEPQLGHFPLEAYGLLPLNNEDPAAFDFTGLETQTLTLYKPKYLEGIESAIAAHMMHEITHSWFGNSVSPKSWNDLWLNEGHAEYYALTYKYERGWPDQFGLTTFEARMKRTYGLSDQWRRDHGPVAKPPVASLWHAQRYQGGTLVLYALHEKLGAELFNKIERAYLKRYRDKSISTDDFIALAADVSGDPSVTPFLADWAYGTKTPPMPNHPDWTTLPAPASARQTPRPYSGRDDSAVS